MPTQRYAQVALVSAAVCGLLSAIPWLAVDIPPITDLPQQVAQIRLLDEALAGSDAYRIQAWHPNKLGYLPLLLGWWIAGPLAAGRLALAAVALLWVTAVHLLARATGRSAPMAVLASIFVFHHATYWGFLNFLVGFPAFVLWYLLVRRLRAPLAPRDGLRLAAAGFVLYSAHVLWLAAALVWLAVSTLLDRCGWRELLRRFLWLAPIGVALALWFTTFSSSGVDERTFWGRPPWVRLQPSWLLGAALGGLRGEVEAIVAMAVAAWLLLGLWQHRRRLAAACEPRLALAGSIFFAAVLALPEVDRHTIFFAARWAAPALVFLVLACPPPRFGPSWRATALRGVVPWILLATLVARTTAAWIGFENHELDGLRQSLDALPAEPTVLGLDLVRTSPRIHGYPYYHLFAYAQVLRGGELNRTFADEASSLVVFRELPKAYPWTDRLEWRPESFRRSDRDYFDFILVHGAPGGHAIFLADPRLEPVTAARRWRLYRVRPEP